MVLFGLFILFAWNTTCWQEKSHEKLKRMQILILTEFFKMKFYSQNLKSEQSIRANLHKVWNGMVGDFFYGFSLIKRYQTQIPKLAAYFLFKRPWRATEGQCVIFGKDIITKIMEIVKCQGKWMNIFFILISTKFHWTIHRWREFKFIQLVLVHWPTMATMVKSYW